MAKRKIFNELVEGVNAMKKYREGNLTLRSYVSEWFAEMDRAGGSAFMEKGRKQPDTPQRLRERIKC